MRALSASAAASMLCIAVLAWDRYGASNQSFETSIAVQAREARQATAVQRQPAAPRTASERTLPEEPRERVDVADVQQTGRRIQVPAGGNLQAALDDAKPGDHIALEAGATYRGPFRLRPKQGSGWIVIASAALDRLPGSGERVNPSHSSLMPKLRSASRSVIEAQPGAHHYRFVGLDIAPADGTFLWNLVELGDQESQMDAVPHHIVIDRSYLHGDPVKGSRRGVALNSRHTAVINSYLSDFKEVGADSQAISGWNGPGPFAITNNYLEAAGENVMFGGADPTIPDLVPSDIEVRRNHMAKPLRWKKDRVDFQGTAWTVKNLFELKNARRVVVDGNLFEYVWPEAQNGFAILFTVRNQDGKAPWSVVEDVTFSNNVVRHAGGGINILGRDDNHPSQQTQRIAIRGNLFEDVGGAWGAGRLFQLLEGTRDVSIVHNTALHTGSLIFGGDKVPHEGFVFENNIAPHNEHGITASGTGPGQDTLEKFFPGARIKGNLIVGGPAARYPRDNLYPGTLEEVGFKRERDGSYQLALNRRYVGTATDGRDPGVDITAITEAIDQISSALRVPAGTERGPHPLVTTAQVLGFPNPQDRPIGPTIFWLSLFLLAYVYVGYPAIMWLRSRVLPQYHSRAPIEPTVSIVIAAHNEAERIEARIENLLELDYPRRKVEIIIGSDGSTDDTVSRARRFQEYGVTVRAFRQWRGKTAVLDDLVPRAKGEIVVLADARQRFDPRVLRALVSHFADPQVGAVSGELMLTVDGTGSSAGQGTAFYWRYEKFIRLHESRAIATVGATGSIYAIRRSLFEPIPQDTILDDVLIPLRIVRKGYYTLFEPEAKAYDKVSATAHQEYVRKLRTIAGAFQLFAREPWLLNPLTNPLWFETVSHKALRLVLPLLHVALFAVNLSLLDHGALYQLTMAGQVGFYVAAAAGHALRHARRRPFFVTVPYAMCLLTWTTAAAFARFVTHRQQATWEPAYPTEMRQRSA